MFDKINKSIVEILGISSLPEEKQKDALEKLGAIVYQEVMLRVLDIMTETDKDEFERLIEKDPSPETMFTFLAQKVPNLDEIVIEEAKSLQEESAQILNEIGK